MSALYVLVRTLEVIDLLIVFVFAIGFFTPFKFKKFRLSHVYLTWSVLIAQLSCGMKCPILICANKLRIASGCEQIAVQFQPTFLNFLSSFVGSEIANGFMTVNILASPFIATWIYKKYINQPST